MSLDQFSISEEVREISPAGHYLGLRIRFAFPANEVNNLPSAWIDLYSRERFFLQDPALRWSFDNIGAIRWSELESQGPENIIARSAEFGLKYGVAAAYNEGMGVRSFGLFFRNDREYTRPEMEMLASEIETLHKGMNPPTRLTRAEVEVLQMIKNGIRIKQVAHDLGLSEGAIKQRLKNARTKLGASNGTHAAMLAHQYGLI